MKTKQLIYTGILAAATVCGGMAAPAYAALEGGALANYFVADNSRPDTNNGLGFALDAIHFWDNYQGISLRGSYANLQTDRIPETDFQRYSASLGYWRYLDGDGFCMPGFRPYVNGGIGAGIQETVTGAVDSDSGLLLEAAFGLVSDWNMLIPNLKFRPELRLDYETVYSDAVDLTVGLGVHYAFGASAPEPVVAAPAPAPAPAAAPAQPAPVKPAPAAPGDSDRDGVTDRDDACPGTARGVPVDNRGCAVIEKVVLKGVTFGAGSSVIKSEAFPTLRSVAAALNANPKLKVEIGGHSDSQGNDQKNQALSEKRAGSVKSFLIKEGVAADRITVKGYGEANPVDTNDTPEGRANNRRVEFKVLN